MKYKYYLIINQTLREISQSDFEQLPPVCGNIMILDGCFFIPASYYDQSLLQGIIENDFPSLQEKPLALSRDVISDNPLFQLNN